MGLSPRSEAEPYGDEASGGGSGLSGATGGLGVFYAEEGREAAESRWLCQMLGEYRSVLGMIMSQCWGQRGLRHFSARRVPRGCCRRTPASGPLALPRLPRPRFAAFTPPGRATARAHPWLWRSGQKGQGPWARSLPLMGQAQTPWGRRSSQWVAGPQGVSPATCKVGKGALTVPLELPAVTWLASACLSSPA